MIGSRALDGRSERRPGTHFHGVKGAPLERGFDELRPGRTFARESASRMQFRDIISTAEPHTCKKQTSTTGTKEVDAWPLFSMHIVLPQLVWIGQKKNVCVHLG